MVRFDLDFISSRSSFRMNYCGDRHHDSIVQTAVVAWWLPGAV